MLSIIIPTHNEIKSNYIDRILDSLTHLDDVQIIVVDNFSIDGTVDILKKYSKIRLIQTEAASRAARLNLGIKAASSEFILLHHPRSILQAGAIESLISQAPHLDWGGFTHKFDIESPILNFTSWYSNKIRADKKSIFYLDHCIFAKKILFEQVGLIPEVDIFEDTEISLLLREHSPGARLPYISTTSSIRFMANGILKQSFTNQKLKWKYYLKFNHKKMNASYEKGLDLNTSYKDSKEKP